MRRGTFKSTQTMFRAVNEARKEKRMEAKKANWTEAAHLFESDRETLREIKSLIEEGKLEYAHQIACTLDSIVRDEIPSNLWKKLTAATQG